MNLCHYSSLAIVNERSTQLDALQQRLEEIKFEKYAFKIDLFISFVCSQLIDILYFHSERLAAILEGSKLDGKSELCVCVCVCVWVGG